VAHLDCRALTVAGRPRKDGGLRWTVRLSTYLRTAGHGAVDDHGVPAVIALSPDDWP
jgi:hypothetical protein